MIPIGPGGIMLAETERADLFSAFKEILKHQKISYRMLGKKTGMAESTVKRIFSIEECSLSKLLTLLAAANLTIQELVTYLEDRQVETSFLSEEAERYFAKKISDFYLYRRLFIEKNRDDFRKKEKLSLKDTRRFLKKLDALGIIKWLPEDRIQFCHSGFLKFRENGVLMQAFYRSWVPQFSKTVLQRMTEDSHGVRVFSCRSLPSSQNWFLTEYQNLIEDFLKKASVEVKTQPEKTQPFGASLLNGPYRVGLNLESPELIDCR